MRRKVLAVGVLLILVAMLILRQGTQVLTPLAGLAGLSSSYTKETVLLPPTLLSVPASNYSFVSEDLPLGSGLTGSLQVADGREVAFYVMNQGNFSLWRAGHPSSLVLAEPIVVSYNFTLSPSEAGTYFFVFDNQDTSPRTVIFNLSTTQSVTVLNPFIQYSGFELLIVGVGLSLLGLRGGGKKAKPNPVLKSVWKCKFCGALNETDGRAFCVECGRSQA